MFGDCVASVRPSEKIKQKWSQTIIYRLPDRSFVAEIRVSTVLVAQRLVVIGGSGDKSKSNMCLF